MRITITISPHHQSLDAPRVLDNRVERLSGPSTRNLSVGKRRCWGGGNLGKIQCQLSNPTPGSWKKGTEECGMVVTFLLFQNTNWHGWSPKSTSSGPCHHRHSPIGCTPHHTTTELDQSSKEDGGSRSRRVWRHRVPMDQMRERTDWDGDSYRDDATIRNATPITTSGRLPALFDPPPPPPPPKTQTMLTTS